MVHLNKVRVRNRMSFCHGKSLRVGPHDFQVWLWRAHAHEKGLEWMDLSFSSLDSVTWVDLSSSSSDSVLWTLFVLLMIHHPGRMTVSTGRHPHLVSDQRPLSVRAPALRAKQRGRGGQTSTCGDVELSSREGAATVRSQRITFRVAAGSGGFGESIPNRKNVWMPAGRQPFFFYLRLQILT